MVKSGSIYGYCYTIYYLILYTFRGIPQHFFTNFVKKGCFGAFAVKLTRLKARCYAPFVRNAKKWGDSYINYSKKHLAQSGHLWHNLSTAAVRKAHDMRQPPGPHYKIWEGKRVPNGIYIQTEYHGKLIRKIVCNGDVRWFIGSNCAVTFLSMDDCMAAIDRL